MAIRNINGHGVSSLSGHHNQQVLRVNMAQTTPGQIGVGRAQPRAMPLQGGNVNPQSLGLRQPMQGSSPQLQVRPPMNTGGHIL